MSETFKYPNASDPTKTLTFESTGGGTNGHLLSDVFTRRLNQITDETVSGIRLAKNLGDHYDQWEYTVIVPLTSASYTDWADILEFFGSSYTNGAVNSFLWTDSDDTTIQVRLVSMDISREMVSGSLCRVKFVIETVNS